MREGRPRLAVIIPARNAQATLDSCLTALERQGVPGASAQLIVVNDGSTDQTGTIARGHRAVVLDAGGRGPAAARNLGARHAEAEILVFLDADTVPEPGWLDAMLQPFVEGDVVAVKGRYVSQQRGLVPRFAQLEFEEKYARLRRAVAVDFVDTGAAAYRRDVLLEAGGFDESFPAQSAEDVELAFRLAARGARFAFNDRARVQHRHTERLIPFLYKKARYGFFRAAVYRRYPRKLGGDSYTPPWMALQIVAAGGGLLALLATARWRPAWALLAGCAAAFLATCWPLLRRAYLDERALLPWVAPMAYLRAIAQGVGLAAGAAVIVARLLRLPENRSPLPRAKRSSRTAPPRLPRFHQPPHP